MDFIFQKGGREDEEREGINFGIKIQNQSLQKMIFYFKFNFMQNQNGG